MPRRPSPSGRDAPISGRKVPTQSSRADREHIALHLLNELADLKLRVAYLEKLMASRLDQEKRSLSEGSD